MGIGCLGLARLAVDGNRDGGVCVPLRDANVELGGVGQLYGVMEIVSEWIRSLTAHVDECSTG